MRKIGFHYDTASNGRIALEKYETSKLRYTFVLMGKPGFHTQSSFEVGLLTMPDISMPVMDGLVATRKIREYEMGNGLKSACIMAVTAVASNDTRVAAFKAGVDDFLVKPLSLKRLRELMQV
jgi:CheY-like chemotaxis protein